MSPPNSGTPEAPAAARYFLPEGYAEQRANLTWEDNRGDDDAPGHYWDEQMVADAARYQFHVYRWGASILGDLSLTSVLDVGCGPGTKLKMLIAPVTSDIEGIDQPRAVEIARRSGAPGRYHEADLENPTFTPHRTFDLILCADVIEHLVDPDPLLRLIRSFTHEHTLVLFSTPERARLRGRACNRSPKPEHVREWARDEFLSLLESRAFPIVESRLYPQDETPVEDHQRDELLWRLGLGEKSKLACHAVLCASRPIPGEKGTP